MPNSRKRRKFACRPGSLSLDRTDAKSVSSAPDYLTRQDEVHQEQDQQQRANDQPDTPQVAENVRVLGFVRRKRQRRRAGAAAGGRLRHLGFDGPGAFRRRFLEIGGRLSRFVFVGDQRIVWLEGSFRRGKPVPTFRRWPAALAVAASRHPTLKISINAWHLPDSAEYSPRLQRSMVPPPRTYSPSYKTSACPGVIARCGSSKSTTSRPLPSPRTVHGTSVDR